MAVRTKRAYEKPSRTDGMRVLVDRLWPRGLKKETARITRWMRDVAPSAELRKWFSHDPKKWRAFRRRYFKELDSKKPHVEKLMGDVREGLVTLVFAAKEDVRNNAVALKEYIEKRLARRRARTTRLRKKRA